MTTRKPPGWSRPRSRRRLLTAVAVTALATGLLTPLATSPATADNTAATDRATGNESEVLPVPGLGSGEWSVTLVTGDTVRLSQGADGRSMVSTVPTPRPDGYIPTFTSRSGPDGTFVVPDDAQAAVDAGILDEKLFDVGYLAKQGFADAASKQVPVIVGYRGGVSQASLTSTAKALPATTGERSLPSIHCAAVQVNKTGADDFWTRLRGSLPDGSKPQLRALAGGVDKVWLDDRVEAALDESVPLVGAPEAWKAGLDGRGVTVAVLDTGIDANHPDVAGKIATSRSFVAGQEVADGHGHGTHVAATIAGSGAASGGTRKGVAPGAQLAIGKVLNNAGSGSVSEIVAGMEWATGEADADIVSMSLGGGPTDGTDPLSAAVNSLSASTDTLFVVAAGNDGPGTSTVGAPGAAASALTVAATDKSDKLANFSSRGPRAGDRALKPDIAAPGVSIVAARASGTSLGTPVDENYTSLNGTSMATPHVAGAAAILAQQHPDWSWSRLKTALMSTSKDAGHTAYEQGAGRVDVARATTQRVTATTVNADYGIIPFDQNAPIERTVTYANDGDTAVTLDLATTFTGSDGPLEGKLTASPAQVTVPAGGTADVTVTLDPKGLAKGSYQGSVVATDDAGTRVTVPVGLQREPKKVKLTVQVLHQDGTPALPSMSSLGISAVDVPGVLGVPSADGKFLGDGTYEYRVQPGTYSVQASTINNSADGGPGPTALMYQPEVTVPDEGASVVMDGRRAVPVTFDVPRPVDEHWVVGTVTTVRTAWDGTALTSGRMGLFRRVSVTPTEKVTKGTFLFSTNVTLANPQLAMTTTSPRRTRLDVMLRGYYDGAVQAPGLPGEPPTEAPPFPEGTQKRVIVDVNLGRPQDIADLDLKGKIALRRMTSDRDEIDSAGRYWGCALFADQIQELKDAGAVGVLLYPGEVAPDCSVPTREATETRTPLPVAQVVPAEGNRVKAMLDSGRPVTVRIDSNPHVDYTYQLLKYHEQGIPEKLDHTYGNRDLATVRSDYHHAGEPRLGNEVWSSYKPVQDLGFATGFQFAYPSTRTEDFGGFYSDVTRVGTVDSAVREGSRRLTTVIDRPTRSTMNWVPTPLTPGAVAAPDRAGMSRTADCSFCRQGDILVTNYKQVNGDGWQNKHGGVFNADARLFRNGVEVERVRTPIPSLGAFELSKDEATYRLEQSGAGNHNVWTFRSRAQDRDTTLPGYACLAIVGSGVCNPQPFIFVGYDMNDDLALDNTVRAGRSHTFDITVNHHASTETMPRIAGLKLSYSLDGGTTWKSARVRGGRDGVYTTTLSYPALAKTSGAVSLRAEAWDAAGNRVEQTTTDAVRLR